MADAKRLTLAAVTQAVRDTRCSPSFGDRLRATVEALEKAEAQHLRLRNSVQTTLDCSYGETDGGIHCPLETPCDKCKREKAEAERDEARAEVARLQDLHTRCAALDDQPGPSCVTLAAEVARLREALVTIERTGAPGATIVAQRGDGHSCSWCRGMVTPCPTVTARAALAGTSDEEKR